MESAAVANLAIITNECVSNLREKDGRPNGNPFIHSWNDIFLHHHHHLSIQLSVAVSSEWNHQFGFEVEQQGGLVSEECQVPEADQCGKQQPTSLSHPWLLFRRHCIKIEIGEKASWVDLFSRSGQDGESDTGTAMLGRDLEEIEQSWAHSRDKRLIPFCTVHQDEGQNVGQHPERNLACADRRALSVVGGRRLLEYSALFGPKEREGGYRYLPAEEQFGVQPAGSHGRTSKVQTVETQLWPPETWAKEEEEG